MRARAGYGRFVRSSCAPGAMPERLSAESSRRREPSPANAHSCRVHLRRVARHDGDDDGDDRAHSGKRHHEQQRKYEPMIDLLLPRHEERVQRHCRYRRRRDERSPAPEIYPVGRTAARRISAIREPKLSRRQWSAEQCAPIRASRIRSADDKTRTPDHMW